MPLEQVRVQLLVSGSGIGTTDDGILPYHLYAACLPPYALGIPRQTVQLYCAPAFFELKDSVDSAIDEIKPGTKKVVAKGSTERENLFPGEVEQGQEFFDYFWHIFMRATSLPSGDHLPLCEIRIISGHCASVGGVPLVACGKTVLGFNAFGNTASVLTVLDCCLSPAAVQALKLKDTEYLPPKKDEDAFVDVPFPVACAKTRTSFCFRLSWDGHHNLTDQTDDNFAPEYPGMSKVIGFPVISSLMVAVKSRRDGDDQDLGTIFVDQFQRIERRYYSRGKPFSKHKAPYHNLHALQSAIDANKINPRDDGLGCLLYARREEWFTTWELGVSLPPSGVEGEEMARIIVALVRQCVMQWHAKNYMTASSTSFDRRAWIRLSKLMGFHRWMFTDFTLQETNGFIVVRFDDGDDSSFHDWAIECEKLPDIVDKIERFVYDNEGKNIWEYTGVDEVPFLTELRCEEPGAPTAPGL